MKFKWKRFLLLLSFFVLYLCVTASGYFLIFNGELDSVSRSDNFVDDLSMLFAWGAIFTGLVCIMVLFILGLVFWVFDIPNSSIQEGDSK